MVQLANLKYRNYLLFLFLTIGIILVEFFTTKIQKFQLLNSPLPLAITIDICFVLPILFYFIVLKPFHLNKIYLIVFFAFCVFLSNQILPANSTKYLSYFETFLILLEPIILILSFKKIINIVKIFNIYSTYNQDFITNLKQALYSEIKNKKVANIIASEISMLKYSMFFWWKNNTINIEPKNQFTTYKKSGFIAIMCALLFVGILETIGLHLLIKKWGIIAYIITIIGAYSLLFILAHLVAVVKRKIYVCEHVLTINIGIIWQIEIERKNIDQVLKVSYIDKEDSSVLSTRKVLASEPNLIIKFKKPINISGIYGIKKTISGISLPIDDLDKFIIALKN